MSDIQESQSAKDVHRAQEEQTRAESSMQPDNIAPPLASMIAAIRAALARGASPDARAAGAIACRSILTVLEAKPGQPLAAPASSAAPTPPASPIVSMLSQPGFLSKLAAMSRDELINLINQVTGAMPIRPPAPGTAGPRFHLIEIPQPRRPGGS